MSIRTHIRFFFFFLFSFLFHSHDISRVECRWELDGSIWKKRILASRYVKISRKEKSLVLLYFMLFSRPSCRRKSVALVKAFQLELLKSSAWISGSVWWTPIDTHQMIATSTMKSSLKISVHWKKREKKITDVKLIIFRSGWAWRFDRAANDMVTLSDDGVKLDEWCLSTMRSTTSRSSASDSKKQHRLTLSKTQMLDVLKFHIHR